MPEDRPPQAPRTDPAQQRMAPGRALEMLHHLRQKLADGVVLAYSENLAAAKQDLRQLANRAREPELRELYQSGHELLSNNSAGLLRRFHETFTADCDRSIAELTGQGRDAWDSVGELSLVDAQDFERDLAVGKLAAKATYACSQQLTALERRLAVLLDLKRLDADSNPLGPRRLFNAFVRASTGNWAGDQLSLVLLETLEHYTAEALPGLYRELNQYLVDKDVLAKLPLLNEDGPAEEVPRPTRGGGGGGGEGGGSSDVFVQLAGALARSRRQDPGAAAAAAAVAGLQGLGIGAGADPMGEQSAQFAPLVLSQLITGLTGLQRGTPQAAASLGVETGEFDPSSSELLHSLGDSPLLRWLKPNDAATVDLVAMLFDCMFSDPEVPARLRGELGRLQVPVLKAALMNKGFFTDQRHPARRLIDVIAGAVRGWAPRDQDTLMRAISSAVDDINAGFEDDTSVFAAQIERLEAILHGADRRARDKVSSLVHKLEQRDRKLVADATVADHVARRCAGAAVPPVIDNFVKDTWQAVLRRTYIVEGDNSAAWQQGLATLEDLLWSVQPKSDPAERRKLMGVLPDLLQRLSEGMERIGRGDDWDDFLGHLMPLHMAAIKPSRPAAAASSTDDAGAAPAPMPERVAGEVRDEGAAIEPDAATANALADGGAPDDTVLPAEQPAPAKTPEEAAADRLAVGEWVAFRFDGKPEISLRACWISRYGGLCLFADRPGEHARVLTRKQLAKALRHGSARLLSSEPLTDRAVAKLLIEAAPRDQDSDDDTND